MLVKELIEKLQKMPQEQPVFLAHTVEVYTGVYTMIEEPQDIFEKEGCTLVSLDLENYILKYRDTGDIIKLVEASSNQ